MTTTTVPNGTPTDIASWLLEEFVEKMDSLGRRNDVVFG
jgi:hypothetical protein